MKINEVIVVEGKNDTNKLKSFFDCDTIETNGTHLSKKVLEVLKEINQTRGIIIFCDPDTPGEQIRRKINDVIPNAKNAFIKKECARTHKKVGVEHASKEELEKSLKHLLTYQEKIENTLSMEEFIALGLNGQTNSSQLREKLGNQLFIGKCNAKTLFKRINMLKMNATQIKKVLEEEYE